MHTKSRHAIVGIACRRPAKGSISAERQYVAWIQGKTKYGYGILQGPSKGPSRLVALTGQLEEYEYKIGDAGFEWAPIKEPSKNARDEEAEQADDEVEDSNSNDELSSFDEDEFEDGGCSTSYRDENDNGNDYARQLDKKRKHMESLTFDSDDFILTKRRKGQGMKLDKADRTSENNHGRDEFSRGATTPTFRQENHNNNTSQIPSKSHANTAVLSSQ